MANGRVVVVGCGVVGNACARELSKRNYEVFVLERHKIFGMETSSRNSEVIHAGIYYPQNSLKAVLCVQGRRLLYDYLESHRINHRKCGKLLIACNEADELKLEQIHKKALMNGITSLQKLSASEIHALEPEIYCTKGILSPETGILDSHAYQESLQADSEACGTSYVYNCEVEHIQYSIGNTNESFHVNTNQGTIEANYVVNAAGLRAISMANRIKLASSHQTVNEETSQEYDTYLKTIPNCYYAKGNYFKINGKSPFRHLVYPIPSTHHGLGVHATLDLQGNVRFGPDVEWITPPLTTHHTTQHKHDTTTDMKKVSTSNAKYMFPKDFDLTKDFGSNVYTVNESRKEEFAEAIQSYWKNINQFELIPDYSGIRPKLAGPNADDNSNKNSNTDTMYERNLNDFQIDDWSVHRMKGLINLFGIESPGLTASLAIANHVADLISHS